MRSRGRWRAPSLAMLLMMVLGLFGCGRVATNYPQHEVRVDHNPFADSPFHVSYEGVSIWVGDRIDTEAARAKQATVFDPMKEAMGESAFMALRQESRRRVPWVTHIVEDQSYDYYRGSLMVAHALNFVVEEGVLLCDGVTSEGVVKVRDLGVLFRHGDKQQLWPFSGDGTVDSRHRMSDLRPGAVVFITIRLPRGFEMQSVCLDSTRIQVASAD